MTMLGQASASTQDSSWLGDQIDKLSQAAQAESNSLRDTAQRLTALWTDANSESDPDTAEWMKQQLRPITAHHAELVNYWLAVRDKVNSVLNGARTFFNAIGLEGPGLVPQQLGQVQLIVPIVLVSLVGLAWAAVAYLHPQNEAHLRAIQLAEQLLKSPTLTDDQRAQILAAINTEIKTKPDTPDPLGLQGALKAALPVMLVLAAIVIVPKLIGQRRLAAAA